MIHAHHERGGHQANENFGFGRRQVLPAGVNGLLQGGLHESSGLRTLQQIQKTTDLLSGYH
jgi:hypothetical protein